MWIQQIYNPKQKIVSKGSSYDKMIYVTKGSVIQTAHEMEENNDHSEEFLTLKQGDLALLGNLIPGPDNRIQISNIFSNNQACRVIEIDVMKMRKILENDNGKLLRLWGFLAKRYIILHTHSELKFFG